METGQSHKNPSITEVLSGGDRERSVPEESSASVNATNDVPMEIESDDVPVATTSDNPETQPVEMPGRLLPDLEEQSESP